MATIDTHVKTITEVSKKTGEFVIHCFSDMKDDGSVTPTLFKSQVLQETKIVDNVEGKEGELLLSYTGDGNVGSLTDGILRIEPQDDDPTKYGRGGDDMEDLIYNE